MTRLGSRWRLYWPRIPCGPLLLIGSALPALWAIGNFVLREHQWHVQNTINERMARYYDWLMIEKESAEEIRLFNLGPHFQAPFQRIMIHVMDSGRVVESGTHQRLAAAAVAAVATPNPGQPRCDPRQPIINGKTK